MRIWPSKHGDSTNGRWYPTNWALSSAQSVICERAFYSGSHGFFIEMRSWRVDDSLMKSIICWENILHRIHDIDHMRKTLRFPPSKNYSITDAATTHFTHGIAAKMRRYCPSDAASVPTTQRKPQLFQFDTIRGSYLLLDAFCSGHDIGLQ